MRIGILTFHGSANYGSVMQAYCAQQFLKHYCPESDVEIIDCVPKKMYVSRLRKCLRKNPFISYSNWRTLRKVKSFRNDFLRLSSKSIITDDLCEATRFIDELEYDVICVGSDTVWRVCENEYSPTAPNIYFLPKNTRQRKIALAVSCDGTDEKLIKQKERMHKLRDYVEDFDYISVRDVAAFDYLRRYGIADDCIDMLPDPTVLWDFTNIVQDPIEWRDLQGERVAGVSIDCPIHKQKVTRYLNSKGYTVYDLLVAPQKGVVTINPANSFVQKLGFYRFIDLLVTDRFHSSLFSFRLCDNAPVVFLEREEKYPNVVSKGRDLFRKMGLKNMVIRLSNKDIDIGLLERTIMDWPCKDDDVKMKLALQRENAGSSIARMLSSVHSKERQMEGSRSDE